MMHRTRTPVLALLLLPLLGCGSGVTVEGKLVKGGAAFSIPSGHKYTVQLAGPTGNYAGEADSNGVFRPRNDRGFPVPGTYEVHVTVYEEPAPGKPPKPPVTKKYPESWTVSSSNTSFSVDIDKLPKK